MELLDHMVILCLIFWVTTILFFIAAAPFCIPAISVHPCQQLLFFCCFVLIIGNHIVLLIFIEFCSTFVENQLTINVRIFSVYIGACFHFSGRQSVHLYLLLYCLLVSQRWDSAFLGLSWVCTCLAHICRLLVSQEYVRTFQSLVNILFSSFGQFLCSSCYCHHRQLLC